MADFPFAAAFPPASREDWHALVEQLLKAGAFDQKLVSKTRDGLRIEPLYERAAGARPLSARVPGAPWTVMQRVDHPDPAKANVEALHDLENGATGLAIVVAGAPSANTYGLRDVRPATFERALKKVFIDAVALRLDAGVRDLEAAEALTGLAEKRKAFDKLDAALGLDPIGTLAATGQLAEPVEAALQQRANFACNLVQRRYRGSAFLADGRPVHDAGGAEAQELAFVLGSAVAYWRALEAPGLDLDQARRQIAFLLAADADQLLTLAKFRALRELWARAEEAAGVTPLPIRLHAETAWRMVSKRDPYVNWLRITIATFAAGLGGADSVTVLPHSAALGLADRFARRIARNTQLLLLEESNLHRVVDPGAGSGAIEDLTSKLAAAAWKLFQEIEASGGVAAALTNGLIQRKVADVRSAREQDIALRKEPLTGVSEFPYIHEAPVAVLKVRPPTVPKIKAKLKVEPLSRIRLSEPFERLRDAAGKAAKAKRPKIFLANLGDVSAFNERSTFAKNFFESGGIEAVSSDGFSSPDTLAKAFKQSKARIACICSSDEVLARGAETVARALKKAGAVRLYVAGAPGLRAAGVDEFIHVGCNALAVLRQAHATLGLKQGVRRPKP
jgi:methylmalonyl-CoA mutase